MDMDSPWIAKRMRLSACTSSRLDNLMDDQLIDIFLKLPVKLLHCLKCVSKRWRSLISDPAFARSYTIMKSTSPPDQHHHLATNFFIFSTHTRFLDGGGGGEVHVNIFPVHDHDDDDDMNTTSSSSSHPSTSPFRLDFIAPKIQHASPPCDFTMLEDVKFKGVSNGLLLAHAIYRESTGNGTLAYAISHQAETDYKTLPHYLKPVYSVFHVWNPITKHRVELPTLPLEGHLAGFSCYQLQDGDQGSGKKPTRIWADSDKTNLIANYNPDKVEFTVVVVNRENYRDKEFTIHVFFSRAANWSVFRVPFPAGYSFPYGPLRKKVVFANGMFYWFGMDSIAAYDPFNKPHQCDVIPFPSIDDHNPISSRYSHLFVTTTRGLHLGATPNGLLRLWTPSHSDNRIIVWELVDHVKKVWSFRYNVKVKDKDNVRFQFGSFKLQSFTGDAGDKTYLFSYPLPIMLLDLRKGSIHPVCSFPDDSTEGDESDSAEDDDSDSTEDDSDSATVSVSVYYNLELCLSNPWPTPVPLLQ